MVQVVGACPLRSVYPKVNMVVPNPPCTRPVYTRSRHTEQLSVSLPVPSARLTKIP